jgi:hypothetical protein
MGAAAGAGTSSHSVGLAWHLCPDRYVSPGKATLHEVVAPAPALNVRFGSEAVIQPVSALRLAAMSALIAPPIRASVAEDIPDIWRGLEGRRGTTAAPAQGINLYITQIHGPNF